MLGRAQILLDHVRDLDPGFQCDEYVADPDGYVRRTVRAKRRDGEVAARETAGGIDNFEDDAEDEDGRNGVGTRRKKTTATLDWLRSEAVKRADC